MVEIDEYRLIMLQFNFTNRGVVPQVVKGVEKETLYECNLRKSRSSGVVVINPTENCSLLSFIEELKDADHELVDAFHQERINPISYNIIRTYHMVRFTFANRKFADPSDEFAKKRDDIYTALTEMCRVAMWRVRAFSNPFYKNGEEISGQRVLSINMEARKPLFHPNGQPVMVWQKDEKGGRIGNAPVQLEPDYSLSLD